MNIEIPYVGSFQGGSIFRTGDPLNAVWRQIERLGTIESLTRIATSRGHDVALARTASLRVRQAVELRRAAGEGSVLTRPLVLYYSMLNLARAVLLAFEGDIGGASHGLRYRPADTLLHCSAEVTGAGTFRRFARALGVPEADLARRRMRLRDLIATLPEMKRDFPLLADGHSASAVVSVRALMQGEMTLTMGVDGISEEEFSNRWKELFPWLANECELAAGKPFTLRVVSPPANEDGISEFCGKYLMHDLHRRENAIWFDQVQRDGILLMPRLAAYLGALFILSNVSRYEPELLAEIGRNLTDVGHVVTSLVDNAERYFPQLVLELLNGRRPVFFE